jgi:alpha-glucosidase
MPHPLPSKWKDDPFMYQERKYDCAQPAGLTAMSRIRNLVDAYEGSLLLGEIAERPVAREYTGPKLLNSCYFFDFLATDTLKRDEVQTILSDVYSDFPLGDFFWALSNHDFARHITRLHPNKEGPSTEELKDFAKLTAALFMFLPGGYCMYQGEEFGFPAADLSYEHLVDPFDRFLWPNGQKRDLSRTPVPWDSTTRMGGFTSADATLLPVDPAQKAVAINTQETTSDSVLNLYRSLIAWRQEYHESSFNLSFLEGSVPASEGKRNTDSELLKIKITFSKQEVIGIFNLSQTKLHAAIPDTAQVLFSHNATIKTTSTNVWNFDQLGWAIATLSSTK